MYYMCVYLGMVDCISTGAHFIDVVFVSVSQQDASE
jgi:hypothetical protein